MKILFDLTPLSSHLSGVERYAINISKNILNNHVDDNEYILLFRNEIHPEFINYSNFKTVNCVVIECKNKYIFNTLVLPRFLYKIKADIYVFLALCGPLLFNRKKCINAIHDLTVWDFPDTVGLIKSLYGKLVVKHALKTSKCIITVSKFSKERIFKILNPKIPVYVVYDGLTEIFLLDNFYKPDIDDYILCLSTIEPRKNMTLLIQAYNELIAANEIKEDLVIVGRKGWKIDKAIGKENLDNPHIHFTGFVDDSKLPGYYKNAKLFVLPSRYEGFGLPIIEAMSQGTIVIAADNSSLREIVSDAGILFKDNNVDDLKQKIIYALNLDNNKKDELTAKALLRAREFDWNNESEKLYKIIIKQ